MTCDACGNTEAHRYRRTESGAMGCDKCMGLKTCDTAIPDVFLGGKGGVMTNENICDDNGNPIPYTSKRELARIMKERKLKFADSAERQKGSRNEMYLRRKTYFT